MVDHSASGPEHATILTRMRVMESAFFGLAFFAAYYGLLGILNTDSGGSTILLRKSYNICTVYLFPVLSYASGEEGGSVLELLGTRFQMSFFTSGFFCILSLSRAV